MSLARVILYTSRLLLVIFAFCALAGCALWKAETWNLDRFRDQRARDIDTRLSADREIVANPFQ